MKRRVPEFATDDDAERFVDTANLEEYDLSKFRSVQFEFQAEGSKLDTPLMQQLYDAVKKTSKVRDTPYKRFVQRSVEGATSSRIRSKGYVAGKPSIGNLRLIAKSRSILVDRRLIHLTTREYRLLELLITRRGMVLSREALFNHLYNGVDEPELRVVDVFVLKLRNKLSAAGANSLIGTVWGRGYMLQDNTFNQANERKFTAPSINRQKWIKEIY